MTANGNHEPLFVIPGYAETLRIEGTARVVMDEEILELGKVKGKRPPAATGR